MKIAIFTDTFYPMVNGVVTAIFNIALPLAKRGHEILIVTPKINNDKEKDYPGVRVKRIKSVPAAFYDDFRWTPTFSYSTYKILRDEKFDLIHFMTPFTVSYLGIKLARMLKIPVVGTFHTFISDPTYYEQMFKGLIRATEKGSWKYLTLFYNSADLVTAPSPSTLQAMEENGLSVPGEVISNGIDPTIFNNDRWQDFRDTYKLGERTVLYFGRMADEKSLSILIEGFKLAWEKDNSLQLLLIGDGPLRNKLEKEINKSVFKDNIIFTGMIAHDELIQSGVFKACWLFASASKTENQPMTILEAQTNGMVCVGANARGIPDLIKHDVNGMLFTPDEPEELADAILTLSKDKETYDRYKEKTIEMIKDHELINVINYWEEKYQAMIDDYRAGKYEWKDYLHLSKILSVAKEFSFALKPAGKGKKHNSEK